MAQTSHGTSEHMDVRGRAAMDGAVAVPGLVCAITRAGQFKRI